MRRRDHATSVNRSKYDRGRNPGSSADSQRAQTQTEERKCFNCNEVGHLRKDCAQQKAVRAKGEPTESAEPKREPKIFTASLSRWLCGTTKADGLQEDLVGAQTTAQVQLLGMTRTALLDTGSQVSIIPLQMLVDALQNGYDLNADVEEIDLDRSKAVYDASGNPMSFKGAVKLAVQVDKGPRHRIGLFVMAGGDDVVVLGTNALKKLGWSLAPNAQSSRSRAEVSRGRRHQRKEAKPMKAAVQQRRTNASKVFTEGRRLYLKPAETKVVPVRCDEMKQDVALQSSGEILPDTEGQGAQHQVLIPKTNSFAGAKIFRKGEVVRTREGAEMAGREPPARRRVVGKARAPKPTNPICGRQTVCTYPRRRSGVRFAEPSRGAKAVSLQKPEAKRAPRKVRLSPPEVSEKSKEEAPAATAIPQPRVARAQRKRVIKREPVGRPTLAKENAQLSLSKVDGNEVNNVKTAITGVCADLTRNLCALKRRLEAVVRRHYVEVVGKNKATKSRGKEGGPGRNERRMRTPVVTARISCSLEAASKELKKRRQQYKAARSRRTRGERVKFTSLS
ncbi:unnamed protein product [Heligmosomoides polygyrus]|uniref:CCHC-type domain-containing protein n=1 Tax=Heligmosomoides polygyrus TaxID=6339 RepID=A0A183GJ79_HELPZ|nr:unnamed protein product [Heligmosomoides polygyrus]